MVFSDIILNFILILVEIVTLNSMILSIIIMGKKLITKDASLMKFYIKSHYLTSFYVCFYICIFILFFYIIRLYNLNRSLDLRDLYCKIKYFIVELNMSFLAITHLFILICIISFLVFLLIGLLHKFFINHVFTLFLYLNYSNTISSNHLHFMYKISEPYDEDLISFYIYKISYAINTYFNSKLKYESLPWYNLHKLITNILCNKYYKKCILVSPIFVILYDCIFNDLVIKHVYPYLLLYIPIMLWRRITKCIAETDPYVGSFLWDIYYKKQLCIYAFLPEHVKLLETFLLTDLKMNIKFNNVEIYMKDVSCFTPVFDEEETFQNSLGVLVKRKNDEYNYLIQEEFTKENDNDVALKWVILCEKYYFINDNKYQTIVHINWYI